MYTHSCFEAYSVPLDASTIHFKIRYAIVLKGLAKSEGLLDLSGGGGAVQQQLPNAHGGSKAWPQACRCCAGPDMPAGYELRKGQLPGQLGTLSWYALLKAYDLPQKQQQLCKTGAEKKDKS